MREQYTNLLIWIAAKLNVWSYSLFQRALNAYPNTEKQQQSPEPAQEIKKLPELPSPDTLLPLVLGDDNEPVPMVFEELPEKKVFNAMFERKYGKNGFCPMDIGGNVKLLSANTVYTLLEKIRTSEEATPTQLAMYGTLMAIIMHAHGEPPNAASSLN